MEFFTVRTLSMVTKSDFLTMTGFGDEGELPIPRERILLQLHMAKHFRCSHSIAGEEFVLFGSVTGWSDEVSRLAFHCSHSIAGNELEVSKFWNCERVSEKNSTFRKVRG